MNMNDILGSWNQLTYMLQRQLSVHTMGGSHVREQVPASTSYR